MNGVLTRQRHCPLQLQRLGIRAEKAGSPSTDVPQLCVPLKLLNSVTGYLVSEFLQRPSICSKVLFGSEMCSLCLAFEPSRMTMF